MGSQEAIGVLIIDDSAFMRKAIQSLLEQDPGIRVLGAARNGWEGIDLAAKLQPHAITLDIEMPELDGLSALPRIKEVCSAEVLMVSNLTTEGSAATLTALRSGAADFVAKDGSLMSLRTTAVGGELLSKIHAIVSHKKRGRDSILGGAGARRAAEAGVLRGRDIDVVVIGASTGGPPVLERIIGSLPEGFPFPVMIAQHMPLIFTRALAERLHAIGPLPAVHAEHHMPILKSHVYLGQGGQHLRILNGTGDLRRLEVSPRPAEVLCKPSVNELFVSAATVTASRTLAIVLTGIGDDGFIGARRLHEAGATLLVQDPESCVVYGMPKAVYQSGIAAASLSPDGMIRILRALAVHPEEPVKLE